MSKHLYLLIIKVLICIFKELSISLNMQILKNQKINLFQFSILVLLFSIGISACSPAPSPSPTPDPSTIPEGNSYLFKSSVSATHKIGSSPCPQRIADIKTFCGKTGDSCTADSAVIEKPHMGLDANFANGKKSTLLDSNPQGSINLIVNFNCQVAMSFDHTYKLVFYKNGVKVDEQDLKINMTVQ